jgi:TetR/AcrR family transcriptional regulator, transcriptional repressor for nem operon
MATAKSKSERDAKQRLLDSAMKLMTRKGFKATTVDEICAEAGLTKGSFFHYFDGKEDLAKATVKHFHEFQQCMFDGADFRSVADPLERVYGRLEFIACCARSPQMPKSCLIGNLVQEIAGTHDDIRSACCSSMEAGVADFERDVAAAKFKHAPDADFDPASVARLYLTVIQGFLRKTWRTCGATSNHFSAAHVRENKIAQHGFRRATRFQDPAGLHQGARAV